VICGISVTEDQREILMKLATVVIAAAALNCASCYAAWEKIGTQEGRDIYFDRASVKMNGDMIKMWSLFDLPAPQKGGDGKSFLSGKELNEFDCKEERIRSMHVYLHQANMGNGAEVSSSEEAGKWKPVAPGTISEKLLKLACSNYVASVVPPKSEQSNKSDASDPPPKANRSLPPPPSATDAMGLFGGWITGEMINTATGDTWLYEIEKSRGKGGMWAANPKTGEVLKGQYTGRFTGGSESVGTISGTGSSGWRRTVNVETWSPPTGATAQGYLKGDLGTVVEMYLDITPGMRPTGSGQAIDNRGNKYQVQF
jgi:hypothetical protein